MGVCMDNFVDCILVYKDTKNKLIVSSSFLGKLTIQMIATECCYHLEEGGVLIIAQSGLTLTAQPTRRTLIKDVPVYILDSVHVVPEIITVHPQQRNPIINMMTHIVYTVYCQVDDDIVGLILSPIELSIRKKPPS